MYFFMGSGLLIGFFFAGFVFWLKKRHQVIEAERIAEDLIHEAEEKALELKEELSVRMKDFEEEQLFELEKVLLPLMDEIEYKQSLVDQKKEQLEQTWLGRKKRVEKKMASFQQNENRIGNLDQSYRKKTEDLIQIEQKYIQTICEKFNIPQEQMLEEIKENVVESEKSKTIKWLQRQEEEAAFSNERTAKRILGSVLHRFQRPYCPERGIGNIFFPSLKVMTRSLGENFELTKILEEQIGVDLIPQPDKLFLNVSGFDPVRRELTRIACDKIMREKRVDEKIILNLINKSKKQLFKKIRSDGNKLAKELGLKGLHPEVRNMMGSLRYRYSFSQNQHFHCAEVGWLCGLMSSELGLDIKLGRRAGMLHDIGKAMDHSIDGGHAVIGADFIDKHGERENVVHAVRAHHYDETPNSDLAYLVIAADAISGARPGARRSTVESYHQKMYDLERIGNSMEGVLQTYILSAGREVRVMVDSKKMDDQKALKLSQDLAHKIEDEMAFPGQIRVTVVRETNAIEYAK